MTDTCPTCGGAVTAHGDETMHYEPDYDALAMVAMETLLPYRTENCPGESDKECAGCAEWAIDRGNAAIGCQALAHALLVDAWKGEGQHE